MVIGLGVGLVFFGMWATGPRPPAGWTGYAPLSSSSAYSSSLSITFTGLHPWVRLLIWLGLIVVWTAVSVVLLRSTDARKADQEEVLE
jgi:heme/copper-type cytochrome/quinol oxidase subunit 1